MFLEERHNEIIKLLKEEGRVKARELQKRFDIGFDTARRDLRVLEEKGLLKRTHGGAIPVVSIGSEVSNKGDDLFDTDFAVVQEAVKLIKIDDVIFISDGPLGQCIARTLVKEIQCTVVTNSIIIANILMSEENIDVFVLGGQVDENGVSNHHFTVMMIESMKFDISFISNATFSSEFGLSVKRSEVMPVIKAVLKTSRKNVGLFTHNQMARTSLLKVCGANAFDSIITDWETVSEEVDRLRELDVDVVVADQHDSIYKKLRSNGYEGWGGSKYTERMKGWDKDIAEIFKITKLKNSNILELGCGAGDVAIKLTDQGHKVTGVDISQTAIEWAIQKASKKSLDIDFFTTSVTNKTMLLNQTYDLVLDGTCLHCLFGDDRIKFYDNVKRLMSEDGFFYVSSVILKDENSEIPQVSTVERCVMSESKLKMELFNEGFVEVHSWSKTHEKHGHFWGVYKMKVLI